MRPALLALLLLAAGCTGAQAACDSGLAERIHAKLHPDRVLDHPLAACKPWRGFAGRSIVVLPIAVPTSEPDVTDFDLDILVLQQADNGNTDRTVIVSRLFQPRALSQDAVRIEDIRIDTARYLLAPDAPAFGVRVAYQGASRANPYATETLSLYVPQGNTLRKVLDGLETTLERGEWDTSCAGKFETRRGSLSLSAERSNGFADLVLRQTRSESRASSVGDECVTLEAPATFRAITLRYDGTAYRVPKTVASE